MLVIPWLQRRLRDEVKVIMICTGASALVAVAYALSSGAVPQISLIVVAMFFLIGILPLYWSVAMARMSGLMAAAGLAFINTVGLLGGFVGPYLYGYVEEATGGTASSFIVLLTFSVLGLLLSVAQAHSPCRGRGSQAPHVR